MNWWAFGFAIVWSFLLLIAGYYSGWVNGKKEAGEASNTYNYNTAQSEISKEDLEELSQRVSLVDAQLQAQHEKGFSRDSDLAGRVSTLESKVETLYNVPMPEAQLPDSYHEDMSSIKSRLTRVERKAGMSV